MPIKKIIEELAFPDIFTKKCLIKIEIHRENSDFKINTPIETTVGSSEKYGIDFRMQKIMSLLENKQQIYVNFFENDLFFQINQMVLRNIKIFQFFENFT